MEEMLFFGKAFSAGEEALVRKRVPMYFMKTSLPLHCKSHEGLFPDLHNETWWVHGGTVYEIVRSSPEMQVLRSFSLSG